MVPIEKKPAAIISPINRSRIIDSGMNGSGAVASLRANAAHMSADDEQRRISNEPHG